MYRASVLGKFDFFHCCERSSISASRKRTAPLVSLTPNLCNLVCGELIKTRFEIVQDNCVGKTFEDERDLPEGIQSTNAQHGRDGKDIDKCKCNTQDHAEEEDIEATGHHDELEDLEVVPILDIPDKVDR